MSSPSVKTIKKLFGLSGNLCAFQSCESPLIDKDTDSVIGEICHIKGKKPDSARYDPKQSDEERDAFENLIMMCSIHHKVIDSNEASFTVDFLLELKKQHNAESVKTKEISDETAAEFLKALLLGEGNLDKGIIKSYLNKIIEKADELPKYLTDAKSNQGKRDLFTHIRQKIEVYETKKIEEFKELNKELSENKRINSSKLKNSIEKVEWNNRKSEDSERLIILGKPGIGKSWLLRYEAKTLAQEALKHLEQSTLEKIILPIWINLADWARLCGETSIAIDSLANLIIEKFTEIRSDDRRTLSILDVWLKRKIRSGNCVILLDALDEIPRNIDFTDKLKVFSDIEAKRAKIYITCRETEYKGSPIVAPNGTLKEVSLLDFDYEQVKQFYFEWFGENSEKAKKFEDLLELNPSVKELTYTPLLLSLICALFDKHDVIDDFPQRRIDIYEQCVDKLFLKEWKDRKIQGELPISEVKEMLAWIGFQIFSEIGEQFTEKFLIEKAKAWLKNEGYSLTPEIIKRIIDQVKADGLLTLSSKNESKPEETEYLFLHRTFLEFFATCGLANLHKNVAEKSWKDVVYREEILYDPHWNEVLQLLGGKLSNKDTEEYVNTLLEVNGEKGEGDMLFRPFILAMIAAKEGEKKLENSLIENLLNKLTEIFVNPPNYLHSYYFWKAIKVWKNGIGNTLLKMLVKEVNSQRSFDGRYGAIDIVRRLKIKEQRIIEQLTKIVDETNSHDEKLLASITLCELGFATRNAVNHLIEMLLVHRRADTDFGYALLNAKEFLPEVISAFVKFVYLENISTFSTRHLLQVLKYFNDLPGDLVDPLIGILSDNKLESHYFHEVVIDGLLNNTITRSANFRKLLSLLVDENIDDKVRGKIARGLARHKNIADKEVKLLLKFFMEENKEFWVSYELIPELAKLNEKHQTVSKKLIQFARDKSQDDYLRVYIAWKLSELPYPPQGAIDFLLDIINDIEVITREKKGAYAILSRMKKPPQKAVKAIIEIIEDDNVDDETKSNLATNLLKSDNPPKEAVDYVLVSAKGDISISTNGETKTLLLLKLKNVPEEAVEMGINLLAAKMPSVETKRDIGLELIKYLTDNQVVETALINFFRSGKVNYHHHYKIANELLRFENTRAVAEDFFEAFLRDDKLKNFNMGVQSIQELTKLHPFWLNYSNKVADVFLDYLIERIQNKHYWQDDLSWENRFLLEIASTYKRPILPNKLQLSPTV